jgi:integrase/recombinase XerD
VNAPAAASSNFLPRPSATVIPGWRTREAKQFFDWCEDHRLKLEDIAPIAIAAYIEELGAKIARPSVKQHLAAIRQLFDYLVTGGILLSNPAGSVRGPKYVVTRGKTPVLSRDEMHQLLDSIDTSDLIGLRVRALLGLMGYTFARVSAVVTLRVEDYFQQGRRSWLRLHEKGGKRHEVPCHHSLDEYLDAWIAAAKIGDDQKGPLFRSFKKGDKLTTNPMTRSDVLYMIKRLAKEAALPYSTCCHTFRATGITAYLQNGGTLEHARQIAAHQSPCTTKLYDRTRDEISLDEVERINSKALRSQPGQDFVRRSGTD